MSTLFVMAGDKGGVGKSTVGSLLMHHFAAQGSCGIIDADDKSGDLALRAKGLEGITHVGRCGLTAGGQRMAFSAVGERLADIDGELPKAIILNLPANAGALLNSESTLLRELTDEYDLKLVVAWATTSVSVSVDALRSSLESGLLSVAEREHRFVIFNPKDGGGTLSDSENDLVKSYGATVLTLPVLDPEDLRAKTLSSNEPFAKIVAGEGGLPPFQRILFKRWLADSLKAIEPLTRAAG